MEMKEGMGTDMMRREKNTNLRKDSKCLQEYLKDCKFSFYFRYGHQKTGIAWLYNLFREKKGGILADDMGLGKTAQISCYLKGLFEGMKIKKAIIICPATLKNYWKDELSNWCQKIPVRILDKSGDRKKVMKKLKEKGGILICSYGMVSTS